MKIGVDISQLAYPNTGVSNYLLSLLNNLLETDRENEYIFFFSSLRGKLRKYSFLSKPNATLKTFKIPPTALNVLWNNLHVLPIENFIGDVDIFLTSDWTEPPAKKAKKITILYDLIVYKYPEETASSIVRVQKKKLDWVKKESSRILCISKSTKTDAIEILGIEDKRLEVVMAGV
jgi:hypothetical protein